MNKKKGFTLLEILMAVALIAVVSLAMYSNFSSGIGMMRRIARPISEEDLSIFFEKLTREIQNSFRYTDIPVSGEKEKLIFPTTIQTKPELGSDQGIGRVTYFYNASLRSIDRQQENLNQIFKEEKVKTSSTLSHVSALNFQYYGYIPSESKYEWKEEWNSIKEEKRIPIAVKIELQYDDEGKKRVFERTIAFPVSG